jgi:L-ascorbate metabolism protein UlaG (beta-lactamase superfamily)
MTTTNPYYQGPPSDHFDGTRFFNPGQPPVDRGFGDILRWKFGSRPAQWPRSVPAVEVVPEAQVAGLRITMVGHATLLIQAAGLNMVTDPVWSDRASPFRFAGPKRVTRPGIDFARLPPIHVVLLSHNHYDHLDMVTLKRLQAAHRPVFVMPLGNDAIVRRAVPDARIVTGDWGDAIDLGAGAEAHLVPANHWSSRGVRDRRMALWCGYMIRTGAGLVYFAGDTGYGGGAIFRDMRTRFGVPDVSLIPIGAYEPRWFMEPQHANPDEAVRIMLDTGAKRAIGIHWGIFQLTDEARDAPAMGLEAALAAKGVDPALFVAGVPGRVYEVA